MNKQLEDRMFLLLLAVITGLFLWLLKPFFAPLFWACAISLLFHPMQRRLEGWWGRRPNTTALVTLLTCMVVVVIPVLLVLASFIREAADLYQRIDSGEIKPGVLVDRLREALPPLQALLETLELDMASLRQRAADSAVAASQFFAQNALSVGQSTFQFLIQLGLMLYVAFFLLRDGRTLIKKLARALPLGKEREALLFAKFAEVTRATIKGNLVVAIVQGGLGWLIFQLLGIPAAILWGVVMAVLSLIPAVGAALIWFPTALILFGAGDQGGAIILLLYGVLVIGLADNLLRPILVGRDTKLPDWLVLVSTLGGLVWVGVHGFVLGPLIAALFVVIWQIFSRDFNPPPEDNGDTATRSASAEHPQKADDNSPTN